MLFHIRLPWERVLGRSATRFWLGRIGIPLLVIWGLLAGARWIWLPSWLDSQQLKDRICFELQRATGYTAELRSVQLASFSLLEFRGSGLKLRGEDGQEVLFVPTVATRLGWKEALRGELAIRSVTIFEPRIQGPFALPPEPRGGHAMTPELSGLGEVIISRATLLWPLGDGRILEVGELSGGISPFGETAQLAFKFQGRFGAPGIGPWSVKAAGRWDPRGSLALELKCESVALEDLKTLLFPTLKDARVEGLSKAAVRLQADQAGIMSWAVELRSEDFGVYWPGILASPYEAEDLRAEAQGTWHEGKWTVEKALISDSRLSAEGELRGDPAGLTGTIRGSGFEFRQIVPHLGPGLLGPALHEFLANDLLGGKARGVLFRILPRQEVSSFLMELQFEEASMRFDPRLPPLEDLAGTLFWQGDRVWFEDLKGRYRGHPFTQMATTITQIGRVSLLEGSFALELSFPELEELLQAVATEKEHSRLLTDVRGESLLELSLRKALLRKEPLAYEARILIKEAWGQLPGVSHPWKVDSGEFLATPERLEVRSLKGLYGESAWKLSGTLEKWGEKDPILDFQGTVDLSQGDLAILLAYGLAGTEIKGEQGTAVEFALSGKPAEATGRISADLSDLGLSYGGLWDKPPGDPLRVELLLQGGLGSSLRLEQGLVKDGDMSFQMRRLENSTGRGWRVVSEKCPAKGLANRWTPLKGMLEEGLVGIEARILPEGDPRWEISITPKDVLVAPSVVGRPLRIHSGQLFLNPSGLRADSVEMGFGGALFSLLGRVQRTVSGKLRVQGGLRGEHLDLDNLTASRGEITELSTSSGKSLGWLDALEGSELGLAFRNMKFFGLGFQGVQARLIQREDAINLEGFTGHLAGGEVALEGKLDSSQQWEVKGALHGASAGEFLSAVGIKETLVEGTLGLQVRVKGRAEGDSPVRYSGEMELEIQRGLVRKFPVLASILSMMNLTQLLSGRLPHLSSEGMVFNRIKGTFQMEQGVLHTQNLRVESEALVLTMVGEIDLIKGQCDLKVGAQPFVGVDRFVDKIPVIRHYLAGPKKTVLATYFLVKGSLENPEVTAIPFQSLGETFMGVFLRLFQNPFADLGPPGKLPEPNRDEDLSP